MAEMATGWACPTCDSLKVTAMLFAQQFGAAQGYYCRNGHKFEDVGDLKAMNPRKLPVPMKATIQQDHEKVEMEIPSSLKVDLLRKFGTPAQLSATLGAVLSALASEKCFIMSQEDIENLEKLVGTNIKNAREVVGVVYAKNEELKTVRQGVAVAQESTNGNGAAHIPEGHMLVEIGTRMSKLMALARFRSEDPRVICRDAIAAALENGWA